MNAPVAPPAEAAPAEATVAVTIDKRVEQFIKLRDKIKEIKERHAAELAPYTETLEQLNSVLLDQLEQVGAESASTKAGTVYKSLKKSASVSDMSAFWSYVVATASWDLLDKKANVTGVEAYVNEQIEAAKKDPTIIPAPPPGVNYSTRYVVGVRRS